MQSAVNPVPIYQYNPDPRFATCILYYSYFLKRDIWVSYSCECQDIVLRERTPCSLIVVTNVVEERAVPAANSRCFILTNIVGQFKTVLHSDRQKNDNHYSSFLRAEVHAFLGAFAKFPKATISSPNLSVRASVRNNSAHTGQIFTKVYIYVFFDTSSTTFNFH